jgi:hypothetical protein
MSIHAELSTEARMRLERQTRMSSISSIIISLLFTILVGLLLGWYLIPNLTPDPPMVTVHPPTEIVVPPTDPPTVPTSLQRRPTAPNATGVKILGIAPNAPISIPIPDIDITTPSLDFGVGMDYGDMGTGGDGPGGGFIQLPPQIQKRCSKADRLARLQETGGTPACEEAVLKSLRWLKQTQKPDGSWTTQHPVAMTGFALLAYLGHCETPLSEEFGDSVLRAITYLVNVGLKGDGRLTNKDAGSIQWVYDHGIATYAMAEAYTFCKSLNINIPELDKVTKKSAEMIIVGQTDVGGWLYRFDSGNSGDNSVGYWQIQALKAVKHTGLIEESKLNRVGRKALDWLEKAQGSNGAIGYRGDAGRSPGLTGGGVLAFQMWDKGNSKAASSGIRYVDKNSEFKWGEENSNLYYHYYNAQAMINAGGRFWEAYNKRFRDELLKAQKPNGTWEQTMQHGPVDVHMATCMATLMLEVYYRFLPGTGAR